ncbi:MAG: NAD(P)H-hydrate epimerase [Treponema sp.]|jgi:hydroxyethylthiazole kinase-like uncharacterized protein yjeF|nr:NAD(P)H-hydrate epimerase [Treponema sp.]
MQRLFADVRPLDKKAVDDYDLTEDLLMENAATALEREVSHIKGTAHAACLIVTGSGNNGGDGIALARKIAGTMPVTLFLAKNPVPPAACRQLERVQRLRTTQDFIITNDFGEARKLASALCLFEKVIIVECLFGSGFHGTLCGTDEHILDWLNSMSYAVKIACDIPGGLDRHGIPARTKTGEEHKAFHADMTVTMGALKTALFSSEAKDYTGNIICAELGIARNLYETAGNSACQPEALLLENSDRIVPRREKQMVHKGTFGHTAIITGQKSGASVIAGSAAFAYGTGLVTLVHGTGNKDISGCPFELMQSDCIPENVSAVAVGMGLGRSRGKFITAVCHEIKTRTAIPFVLDADIFFSPELPDLLSERSRLKAPTVLTPHPKEFLHILALCNIKNENGTAYCLQTVLEDKLTPVRSFCHKYPGIVLVLKDATTLIACQVPEEEQHCETGLQLFVSPLGKNCLAKGGSGDVLAGVTAALLSQPCFLARSGTLYPPLFAAVQAVLAHAAASQHITSSWGMTPFMLIEKLREDKGI